MIATAPHSRRAKMPRPLRGLDDSTYLGRLAARLRTLRIKAGFDHDEAATAITNAGWAVTKSTIYKWEQGKATPHYVALPFVAKAYGVDSPRNLLPKE